MEYIRASSSKFNSHVYVSLLRGVAESSDLQSYNRLFTEAQEKGSEFCADDRISIVESLIKGNLISVIPNVSFLAISVSHNWLNKGIFDLFVECVQ